jgi:hypothetical protein
MAPHRRFGSGIVPVDKITRNLNAIGSLDLDTLEKAV